MGRGSGTPTTPIPLVPQSAPISLPASGGDARSHQPPSPRQGPLSAGVPGAGEGNQLVLLRKIPASFLRATPLARVPFRGRRGKGLGHSPTSLPPPLQLTAVCIKEAVDFVADKCGGEVLLVKMIQQETARAAPRSSPGTAGTHRVGRGALLALCCLALCSRGLSTSGAPERDFCSQILNSSVKPGFPKAIETNDPGVHRAARHSAEKFNNCSNDVFLFRESRVSRALVQIVNGLKYVLSLEIGRTTCKKTKHPSLDSCNFQTNHTLQRTLSCYSEVWVVPWLQKCEVPVLLCH